MKKSGWVAGIIGLMVTCLVVGLIVWRGEESDSHPVPVDISFEETDLSVGPVRIRGTAHYVARVNQHVAATLFSEAKTIYSYGLFPMGDISSKEIRILIRTDRPVPKNIDYEYLEMEGFLEAPTRVTVPFQMERVLGGNTGYFFSPDLLVLQPWSQRPIGVD